MKGKSQCIIFTAYVDDQEEAKDLGESYINEESLDTATVNTSDIVDVVREEIVHVSKKKKTVSATTLKNKKTGW